MDIEITGYRVLYSESIAGRGIAMLISWLGTAGPVDYFNRVFEEYIDLQFLLVGYRPHLASLKLLPKIIYMDKWL